MREVKCNPYNDRKREAEFSKRYFLAEKEENENPRELLRVRERPLGME